MRLSRLQSLSKPPPTFSLKLTNHVRHQSVNAPSTLLSTVHRGTHFENRSITLLEQHLSMTLTRVGGKGDGGIDMVGWWWIPYAESGSLVNQCRRIRVIAQCKAEKKKIGPKYIRELEGVLHRFHMSANMGEGVVYAGADIQKTAQGSLHTAQPKHTPPVGLLISESPFTKATIIQTQSSSIPLLLLYLPPEGALPNPLSPQNELGTAIWNTALAGDRGVLGGQMEIRWERSVDGGSRPGLWWKQSKLCNRAPSGVW